MRRTQDAVRESACHQGLTLSCILRDMDLHHDLIRPETADRVRALANVLERPADDLVADAIEMLRHDTVPCTKPPSAAAARRAADKAAKDAKAAKLRDAS